MKCVKPLTFLAAVFTLTSAQAIMVLDQDAKVQLIEGTPYASSTSVSSGTSGWDLLQTFTAGQTGVLTNIALQTYQSSGSPIFITLALFIGNGTDPGQIPFGQTTFINTQSITAYNAGGMVSVDVSNIAMRVTNGSTYSYSISTAHDTGSTATASRFVFAIGTSNPDGSFVLNDYAGGRAYRKTWTNGTTPGWEISANFATDRGFQTYVDVSAVPEISTGIMFLLGACVIMMSCKGSHNLVT